MLEEVPGSQREAIAREIITRSHGGRQFFPTIHVPPEGTATLRVSRIAENSGRVIVLFWHRNWWPLSFVKLWSFVRVTYDLAEQINPR